MWYIKEQVYFYLFVFMTIHTIRVHISEGFSLLKSYYFLTFAHLYKITQNYLLIAY